MKQIIPLTALAALAAASPLHAQTPAYSKPSGYETINLQTGFNFVGIRLVESAIVSGTFTSNTSTTLVDSNATFSLNATTLYLVEFGGTGPLKGLILEALGSSFSGNTLSGLSDITADYVAPYTIRPAQTIGGIFGTGANVILQKGSPSTADLIFVPKSSGDGFDTYYHTLDVVVNPSLTIPGAWQQIGNSGNKSTTPLNYLDGFYVQIRGPQKNLVVTGQVKTNSILLPAVQGFSYFSSTFPVGTTLATSELANSVVKGSPSTADLIFLPNNNGGFDTYYHTLDVVVNPSLTIPGVWQQIGSSGNKATTPITSGFIFQRRGASANIPLSPPTFYGNL